MQTTEHKIRTLVHQLTEIIGVYARSFEQWREDPSDLGRYERTHANLDLVRLLTEKAFPGGRGELGELLLCHSELKLLVLRRRLAARAQRPLDSTEGALRALEARHRDAVASLSALCAQRSQPPAAPATCAATAARLRAPA